MHDRVLRLVAVAGGLGFVVLTAAVGCDSDKRKADETVGKTVNDGVQMLSAGRTDDAQKTLTPAAADTVSSITTQINAKSALGQSELDTANQILAQITARRIELARLVWDISQLGRQIEASNNLIEGFKKYEPIDPRQAIEGKISEAQGSDAQAAWVSHEKTQIPALSASAQEISRLEGEITERQGQIKGLTAERSQALADADKAVQESETLKGQESVDAYKKGAEFRRKAADTATKIDVTKNELASLQRQLGVAQGQKKIAEDAVAQFKKQDQQLQDDWDKMKEQIDALQAKSRDLLEASGGATETIATTGPSDASLSAGVGGSIRVKAARLAEVVKQTEPLYQSAEQQVNSAIGHFESAAKLAEDLSRDLKGRQDAKKKPDSPEHSAWQAALEIYPAAGFRLYAGISRQTLASIHAQRAGSLKARVELMEMLQPILEKADLKLPTELEAADLGAALSDAHETANKLFTEANEQLVTVSESPQLSKDGRGTSAKVARLLTMYAWSQMARELGDATNADARLNEALSIRNEVMNSPNAQLPALPAEIAPPPPPPVIVASPTTEPTTAPTTAPNAFGAAPAEGAPATEGAPAPAPAEGTTPAPAPATPDGAPAAPAVPPMPAPPPAPAG